MALSQTPNSGFAGLPHEIRDMVFAEVASAARARINIHCTYYALLEVNEEYTGCIKMLHEWASRSHIAKAACEKLWVCSSFTCIWSSFSDVITRPNIPLYLASRAEIGGGSELIHLETLINPRDCLRELELEVDLELDDPSYHNFEEQDNLYNLGQELAKLATFPRLRMLRIDVAIPRECDAYHKGMIFVESLSQPCRELRRRLRTNFSVTLNRDRWMTFESWDEDDIIDEYEIGWMWDPPTHVPRASITAGLSDVEEHIRALIGDIADANEQSTSLQNLRAAAAKLPRRKEEILQMREWSVGCGLSMEQWRWMRIPKPTDEW